MGYSVSASACAGDWSTWYPLPTCTCSVTHLNWHAKTDTHTTSKEELGASHPVLILISALLNEFSLYTYPLDLHAWVLRCTLRIAALVKVLKHWGHLWHSTPSCLLLGSLDVCIRPACRALNCSAARRFASNATVRGMIFKQMSRSRAPRLTSAFWNTKFYNV